MRQVNRWSSVFGMAMLLLGAAFVSFPGGAVLADTSFSQIGADIDGEAAGDNAGVSVAMSADGSRVAIGAINNDGGGGDAGQVRVYTLVNGVWTQTGADIDGEAAGDYSGGSVAMSADGSRVAIGSRFNDGNGSDAGQVRVYTLINGVWTQTGADIDGEAAGDNAGVSVAMSADGSRVAIGALYNGPISVGGGFPGTSAGQVRVYTLVNGVWTQTGADIDGEGATDNAGGSVALSADGSRVAIGALNNDGGGNFGVLRGQVRVFTFTNGVWTQTGADIDGEAGLRGFGRSVAMSADGSRVTIGAMNDSNAGQVQVYEGVELTTTTTSIASATTTIAPVTTTIAPVTTTVMSPLVLPSTGSQSDGWLIVGIFALILGTVLVTRRRNPR